MPKNTVLNRITSPALVVPVTLALDAISSALSVRRKPRSSKVVLRKALVGGSLSLGSQLATSAGMKMKVTTESLRPPRMGFAGVPGDIPVRISPSWEGTPAAIEADGLLVVVAGPDFEEQNIAAQHTMYQQALASYMDPMTAAGLVAARGVLRFGAHRAIVGSRAGLGARRTAAYGLILLAGESALLYGTRKVSDVRRRARAEKRRATLR